MAHLSPPSDDRLIDALLEGIPEPDDILNEASERLASRLSAKHIRENFYEAATELEEEAHKLYLEYQQKVVRRAPKEWIDAHLAELRQLSKEIEGKIEFAKAVSVKFAPMMQKLEFRLSQMRKARGGGAWQKIIPTLLELIGIDSEEPHGKGRKILKRIDIVVPDQKTALNKPDKAYFISAKRTLRERWKQSIPERNPNWRVFIVTMDDDMSVEKAKEINQYGAIAYIPDNLKSRHELNKMHWIRRLSDLPADLSNSA